MLFTTILSILALASASPSGPLQRRTAMTEATFSKPFTLQPSNEPIVSLIFDMKTYFQGDGNLVMQVPFSASIAFPPLLENVPAISHLYQLSQLLLTAPYKQQIRRRIHLG